MAREERYVNFGTADVTGIFIKNRIHLRMTNVCIFLIAPISFQKTIKILMMKYDVKRISKQIQMAKFDLKT